MCTAQLIKEERTLKKITDENREMNRRVKRRILRELKTHRTETIPNTIEKKSNM